MFTTFGKPRCATVYPVAHPNNVPAPRGNYWRRPESQRMNKSISLSAGGCVTVVHQNARKVTEKNPMMLRILSSNAVRSVKNAPLKVIAPVATRNFFWGKKDEAADDAVPEIKVRIKTDKEHQFGRRKEELDAAEEGIEAFENSSLVPPSDAGSWENPIMVRTNVYFIITATFF
jgi:hypothetical protein